MVTGVQTCAFRSEDRLHHLADGCAPRVVNGVGGLLGLQELVELVGVRDRLAVVVRHGRRRRVVGGRGDGGALGAGGAVGVELLVGAHGHVQQDPQDDGGRRDDRAGCYNKNEEVILNTAVKYL